MSNSQINLDRLAAQHAQEIIRRTVEAETDAAKRKKKPGEVDNTVTKSLGVLQEDGVYACFLYLKAKEKENGNFVVEELLNVLAGLGFGWDPPKDSRGKVDTSAEAVLQHISDKVTADLTRLLLAKETLEQTLIYARYGAKARANEGGS